MKSIFSIILFGVMSIFCANCATTIKNAQTETVHIFGNCGMCKKTIEKAALKKGEAKADWNQDSKMAQITFDAAKTNVDVVLKRIATAGYDSEKYRAADAIYANLPECCQYERPKTVPETLANVPPTGQTDEPSGPIAVPNMPKKMAATAAEIPATPPAKTAENPLFAVYSSYFELKDALITSDGSISATKAGALFKSIDAVKLADLTPDARAVWLTTQPKLSADAEQIKGTTEIERQRANFAELSKNLYALMKVVKPETDVFYDHCPMYDDGKGGSWLSKERAIKNPFYGSSMLTCGKVTEKVN